MKKIEILMKEAISENVFPGGVILVSKDDTVLFHEAYGHADIFSKILMSCDTIFDLASLTKPLATTLAVIKLIEDSKLDLHSNLGSILEEFKNTDKEDITIYNLLVHNSGICDYKPYYKRLCRLPNNARRSALRELLVNEPLIYPTGKEVLYSDLGFMILCWVVESVSKKRLDKYLIDEIYKPAGVDYNSGLGLFFIDLDSKRPKANFASTEQCLWRNRLLTGAVHDENAYVVGGIEGHSGLFGTAFDVNYILQFLLNIYHGRVTGGIFSKDIIQKFFSQHKDTGRALGFDIPSSKGSSSGRFFSKKSVGHLGFTGTSFWMDLDRSLIIILLTNRIHPLRDNIKIKEFRPKLHDAVMKNILII